MQIIEHSVTLNLSSVFNFSKPSCLWTKLSEWDQFCHTAQSMTSCRSVLFLNKFTVRSEIRSTKTNHPFSMNTVSSFLGSLTTYNVTDVKIHSLEFNLKQFLLIICIYWSAKLLSQSEISSPVRWFVSQPEPKLLCHVYVLLNRDQVQVCSSWKCRLCLI